MIDVASLSFSYVSELTGDRVEALKDVDLSADAGSLTLVCGASGCGKSTLMKALTGLVPQMTPGELDGVVRINGRNLADVALTDVGHLCSSVFQNPRTQFFCDTVAEELAFCGENYGRERVTLRQQSERAAKLMGISHLMERKLTTLSGGQLQKVALACALASGAPVLLADEPTSNLDPAAISEVRAALKVLKEQGLTIVVVEHRLHFLRGLADQVLLMEDGRVTRRWNGAEFFSMGQAQRRSLGLRTLVDPGPPETWVGQVQAGRQENQVRQGQAGCREKQAGRQENREATPSQVRLSCRGLSFAYGASPVFEGLDADFPAGQITCIAGANGVGKTTLVRVLCGLAAPSSGTISLDGVPASRKTRRSACALVMQDTGRQLFSDTLAGELTIGASHASGQSGEQLLADFDLANLGERHPLSLSGGQKQRLVIAAARATGRPIVILDEPTSGVDARHLDSITATLRRIADEGAAVVVVTHDGEFAAACADRLITLTATGISCAREGDQQ
ncbi:MAG: energy-coupling factor ABC transporter ATP-binding protein [Actinomyces graevenitzii]|uniref:Energy-coupling factor ABC transporter ATP-binding protein n=1 Tax=Actinomyces graevenitzii TaxID=55565 RepID=A0A9E7DD27_9ACTO|nr:energy-coupling factor ABC transporter ATP-binding protein [Actinomyces graevenitzii]UQF79695.1 MAG: energy-coupling factor ABC transporter ATP-binding protein [Actinomyces graevenitzii]